MVEENLIVKGPLTSLSGVERYWTNKGPGGKHAILTYEQLTIWFSIQEIEAEKQGKAIFPGSDQRPGCAIV